MFKEFKEFALKGNLIDMAIAFVMGAAFIKLSGAFIEDLIMPVVGKISGGLDFSNKFIALSENVKATNLVEAKKEGAVLAYGDFITVSINFLIVAIVMFLIVNSASACKNQPRGSAGQNAGSLTAAAAIGAATATCASRASFN